MSRLSLLSKLLLAILLPTLLTFAGFGLLGHFAAARALEAELGRRLSSLAAVVAGQVSEDSVQLLAAGDEDSRTYRNLRRRLDEVRAAAGVARVYLFATDRTVRVDTDGSPIGARLYTLDSASAELRQVFREADPRAAASLLFRGRDGSLYKSGYAPVRSSLGAPRFAVGVDGSAALYQDLIGLRRTLFIVGGSGAAAMVLLALLLGRRITGPLIRLTASARAVGSGVLDQPIAAELSQGRDEVAVLAQGLESMRQDLRARDERMQMMLAGIAHEVRNPLGGMELFAGLLREELEAVHRGEAELDGEAAISHTGRILKELRHLQAVVADFLEYARRPRPALLPTALAELLHEVADSARAKAPPHVEVQVELPADGLAVLADGNQLRRALLNLAHNAVQACAHRQPSEAAPGRVQLVAQAAAPGRVTLRIRDNGSGIPADVLPKIWTPFFTTRAQGTGLGLSFVHEIITDHGGRIDVTTGADGTTFTIDLAQAA